MVGRELGEEGRFEKLGDTVVVQNTDRGRLASLLGLTIDKDNRITQTDLRNIAIARQVVEMRAGRSDRDETVVVVGMREPALARAQRDLWRPRPGVARVEYFDLPRLAARRLLTDAGLAHDDVVTVAGGGLRLYQREPFLEDGRLVWREGASASLNADILRPADDPFQAEGGLRVLGGGLGRAVIKTSAVKPQHRIIEAPARVFDDQESVLEAFRRGELERDFVAVVRFQGPMANGMPELHSLTPTLGVLLDRGFKVALVTDGRMSGASGKVPAAIHVTPEAWAGGPLARVRDGDVIPPDRTELGPQIESALATFGALMSRSGVEMFRS